MTHVEQSMVISPNMAAEVIADSLVDGLQEIEEEETNTASSKEQLLFAEEEPLADVALIVEDKTLFSSRSLLAFSSPVFRCMFSSHFREKDQREIKLPGKSAKVVNEMLRFLHPAMDTNLENGVDSAFQLLPLAEEYQIQQLTNKCEETILEKVLSQEEPSGEMLVECLLAGVRYSLGQVILAAIEKCSEKNEFIKHVQACQGIPSEIKNKIYEKRMEIMEKDMQGYKKTKDRFDAVRNRIKAIIGQHEDHCRCRTELKLRSNLQRQCLYCARHWCSDHVSTDAYRNSYWFYCNHRIGYTVVNDCLLRSVVESNDL